MMPGGPAEGGPRPPHSCSKRARLLCSGSANGVRASSPERPQQA